MRQIFEGLTGTDRHLLTFIGANHNAGAPMPAPAEAIAATPGGAQQGPADHYLDAVWDNVRMNNIAQHFATGFMDLHLKADASKAAYFDLVPNSEDGVFSLNEDGSPKEDHSYWEGFPPRSAVGLTFETKAAGE